MTVASLSHDTSSNTEALVYSRSNTMLLRRVLIREGNEREKQPERRQAKQ
jgi:hypothetical protein